MTRIELSICGDPCPQPRPRARAFQASPGKWIAQIYNPNDCDGWRKMIECAARPHVPAVPIEGPITLSAHFYMERPPSHFTSKGALTASAPREHRQTPDVDNLLKPVMDALTDAGLWRNDSHVCRFRDVSKQWAKKHPGVHIIIETAEPAQADPIPLQGAA